MYWIEIYFENGKTLRKESHSLNEIFKVLNRYTGDNRRFRVQAIKSGRDTAWSGEIVMTEGIVI